MGAGIATLILIALGVAIGRAVSAHISLWRLRKQPPAPPPAWYESRVWTMACGYSDARRAHPAHRWRRDAWTSGGRPTSHPNWCPGYAEGTSRPGAR